MDKEPKLYMENDSETVCGCIGFVRARNTGLNVPNTLLKKDIRDVTASPTQKVYAVFSKDYLDEKYSVLEKLDKSIDFQKYCFTKEIETLIERAVF